LVTEVKVEKGLARYSTRNKPIPSVTGNYIIVLVTWTGNSRPSLYTSQIRGL